jgi:nuclear transport factor 2 (NTF2) superfamily protein
MIIKEFYRTRKDGVNLYRTYSNENWKIHKINTDEIYDEAIDVENAPYIYEETDIPIEVEEEEVKHESE